MPIELTVIVLVVLGFILILIEIFLVPGFNIFGVLGFLIIVLGVYLAYAKLSSTTAHIILAASIISALITVRLFIKSRVWKRLVLETKEEKALGFEVQSDALRKLIGKKGVSHSPLRPAGSAIIEGRKFDVVTEGGFIDRNVQIRVIKVEGNRIVVREVVSARS